MTRGLAYSKQLLIVCIAGVTAPCAMALVYQHLASEWDKRLHAAADREVILSKHIAAQADCGDSDLDALRARVGTFRGQLGAEDTWERLVRKFGMGWTAEAEPTDRKDGYSYQIGTFVLLSPTVSNWPSIVEAVKAAEQIPGVAIARFEMKTSGSWGRRAVDHVNIVVEIHSRRNGTLP